MNDASTPPPRGRILVVDDQRNFRTTTALLLRAEGYFVRESTPLPVDVRIVAATHRDIELEVREKRFRQDLYYRLNVVTLRVPPLRERLEDVPELAEHFLKRAKARGPKPKRLSTAAVEHLMGYSFPGNLRELENLVERAAALSQGEELLPEDFLLPPSKPPPTPTR